MKVINTSTLRNNIKALFEECESSGVPILVTTSKDNENRVQQMIIISKELFDQSNLDDVIKESK